MAVGWDSLLCYLLVFSLYWKYLTTVALNIFFFFSLNCALLVLQYSFLCCLWFTLLLWAIFHDFLSCLSWYAVCLFPYWCSVQDVRIFQIFYSAAYLWSIGECLCALKLGWIQLCCFDLFFLFLSYSYPHRICLFVPIPLTL